MKAKLNNDFAPSLYAWKAENLQISTKNVWEKSLLLKDQKKFGCFSIDQNITNYSLDLKEYGGI